MTYSQYSSNLSGPIPDCSLKHTMSIQCLQLVSSTQLDDDERTVEEAGKATPSQRFSSIHAPTWMCSDESLYTDEFQRSSILTLLEAFHHEYRQILMQYQSSGLFGIQAYTDGPVGSKNTVTQNRISITVPYPEQGNV